MGWTFILTETRATPRLVLTADTGVRFSLLISHPAARMSLGANDIDLPHDGWWPTAFIGEEVLSLGAGRVSNASDGPGAPTPGPSIGGV